jgi:hypothetical protein
MRYCVLPRVLGKVTLKLITFVTWSCHTCVVHCLHFCWSGCTATLDILLSVLVMWLQLRLCWSAVVEGCATARVDGWQHDDVVCCRRVSWRRRALLFTIGRLVLCGRLRFHVFVDGWCVLGFSCGTLVLHSYTHRQLAARSASSMHCSLLRNTAICLKRRGVHTAGPLSMSATARVLGWSSLAIAQSYLQCCLCLRLDAG